jgi:hypothetical protein
MNAPLSLGPSTLEIPGEAEREIDTPTQIKPAERSWSETPRHQPPQLLSPDVEDQRPQMGYNEP